MNLSYNISGHLSEYLTKIEKLRIEILTFPLSPKSELRLRWNANLDRIVWTLSLNENAISKPDVAKILSSSFSPKKKLTKDEADVLAYRNSMEYLRDNWLVSSNSVSMTTIKKLYDLSCRPSMGKASGLTEYSEKRIASLLTYLQKGQDPPILQAGLVQSELINITPFDNGNGRVARLLSYLYLYKGGWDFRGMLNIEEYYKRDIVTYKRMLNLSKIQGNMTLFLEYFTFGIGASLEKTLENIKGLKSQDNLPSSFWKLNNRQQSIISVLENPGEKITNKDVQKKFGVSQITASRDLTHLTSLGLLLAHGKGRSVYYTKV